jgi:basic amino acid/polyamine antiporter, APA family
MSDRPHAQLAPPNSSPDHLERGFGVLRATALNMTNMVGVGPFITIPLILGAMGGPQALLGWVLGALLAACDGMVWAELGAAWPGSGGSYRFLREAYGHEGAGRLMAFLFIWQFLLSGPLEIASGMIGFSQYAKYLLPGMTAMEMKLMAAGVGVLAVWLLYRQINSIGRLTVALWLGTVATMAAVILLGAPHFSARMAFDFPPGAFTFSRGFFLGLGSAMLIAMYDYLGYYDVCYIGDEVRDPARTIPRSILWAVILIAVAYLTMETVIIGVLPWRQAVQSQYVISDYMQLLHGRVAAVILTGMVLWTAFAATFAVMLGYSRVPYAAARDGYFFKAFARLHPTKHFPHVSLLAVGGVTIASAFLNLDVVISALMTTRILVQFVAQIFALPLLRKRLPSGERPYRMPLYPFPAALAMAGWAYIFLTSGWRYVAAGMGTLALGVVVYLWRAKATATWPFAKRLAADSRG